MVLQFELLNKVVKWMRSPSAVCLSAFRQGSRSDCRCGSLNRYSVNWIRYNPGIIYLLVVHEAQNMEEGNEIPFQRRTQKVRSDRYRAAATAGGLIMGDTVRLDCGGTFHFANCRTGVKGVETAASDSSCSDYGPLISRSALRSPRGVNQKS